MGIHKGAKRVRGSLELLGLRALVLGRLYLNIKALVDCLAATLLFQSHTHT